MGEFLYESDVDPAWIEGKRIAVLGYGSQGHAHALNLRDRGHIVLVGGRPGGNSWQRATADGFTPVPIAEVVSQADVLMITLPDMAMRSVFEEHISPNLRPGQAVLFAHGFNIVYGLVQPPEFVDVILVAPKAQGEGLRKVVSSGGSMPALFAIHRDFSGMAREIALGYALGIGCAKAGLLETTFREETECDLFSEQAVLCGGLSGLIRAGFETLVSAGYSPDVAYLECVHELKLVVDLIHEGGLSGMRRRISDTAQWGEVVGETVIGESSRGAMKSLLADIQTGAFANGWVAEYNGGAEQLEAFQRELASSTMEQKGKELRAAMGLGG